MTWDGTLLLPTRRAVPIAYGAQNPLARIGGRRRAPVFDGPQAKDIGHVFGGRAAKPQQPIVLVGADGRTPICIVTDGLVEAAEMEDIALEAQERAKARVKEHGTQIPFAEYRERHGLPAAEKMPELFAQALEDRIARHKQNPVSDPARQPLRPSRSMTMTVPEKTWSKT